MWFTTMGPLAFGTAILFLLGLPSHRNLLLLSAKFGSPKALEAPIMSTILTKRLCLRRRRSPDTKNSTLIMLSLHIPSTWRFIVPFMPPVQDLSFIQALISRNSSLLALVKFTDGRWTDLGLLTAINDLRLCSFFSDSPPVHPVRDLANKAPFTRSRVGSLRIDADSPEAISDEDRSKVAASFWSKIWAKRSARVTSSQFKAYLAGYSKKINNDLLSTVSMEDVLSTIKSSGNSCAGPDGISFAAWRAIPEFSAKVLFGVFRAISAGQPPPRNFNKGLLFLLPKKFTGLIADTRPLSVTNTDNRILARTVAHKIMPSVENFIEPAQKGFLTGRQGTDHVLDVKSFFYEGVENNIERYVFLLHTAKAFDSIDHGWIKYVLKYIGFPPWFLNFVAGVLSDVTVSPFFGKGSSISIDIERGVKQGCPLSPLLFVIAYDPLLFFLRSRTNNEYFAFADDLASTACKIADFYPALNLIDEFAVITGLGVNKSKSLVLSTLEEVYPVL